VTSIAFFKAQTLCRSVVFAGPYIFKAEHFLRKCYWRRKENFYLNRVAHTRFDTLMCEKKTFLTVWRELNLTSETKEPKIPK